MIDIHCHILPDIDDGPSDIHESIEMAKAAASDGITKIVATPHVKNTFPPGEKIGQSIEQLNQALIENHIPVEILQGADVYALLDPSLFKGYTINHTEYILIEFPHSHFPIQAKEAIFRIITAGYRPIITHPERNPSIIRNPHIIIELLDDNVHLQITADSLTGAFGPDSQACASYLLSKDVVSFMATDAHSAHHRRPVLSEGLMVAEKIIGKERALRLVTTNPEAVINGERIRNLESW